MSEFTTWRSRYCRRLRLADDAPGIEVEQTAKEMELVMGVERVDLYEVAEILLEGFDALMQAKIDWQCGEEHQRRDGPSPALRAQSPEVRPSDGKCGYSFRLHSRRVGKDGPSYNDR
jgi:hypothetical protein